SGGRDGGHGLLGRDVLSKTHAYAQTRHFDVGGRGRGVVGRGGAAHGLGRVHDGAVVSGRGHRRDAAGRQHAGHQRRGGGGAGHRGVAVRRGAIYGRGRGTAGVRSGAGGGKGRHAGRRGGLCGPRPPALVVARQTR